jgi:hypothetical protein
VTRWRPFLRRRGPRVLLGVLTIVAVGLYLAAPPAPRDIQPATFTIAAPAIARGVVHVHTTRSDGSGTIDEVAAAAASAGLQFVIATDHGDGTRVPLAPAYRSGVLCLDGVEVSTTGGHYLAFGLGETPFRLAGEPAEVVEDVGRFGGFGVAAHPDSAKPELAWRDWAVPIDGLEWFNLDSEWRDESTASLARAILYYPFRSAAALGALAGDGGLLLPRWAGLARTRRVIGVAGVDAHARLGTEGGFDRAWVSLRAPGYEAIFHTAQVSLELPAPLTGDAARDAAVVLDALRQGRSFSTITARAPAGRVALVADRGGQRARMGQFLGGRGPVVFTVEADAPSGAVVRLSCDGRTVTQTFAATTFARTMDADEAGAACQAIVGWPGASPEAFVTWAVTNPIYLRAADPPPPIAPSPVPARSEPLAAGASAWTVEQSPGSDAAVAGALPVTLTYALAPGERASQYAALVTTDVGALSWARWLRLALSADRQMRVSLQLREPAGGTDGRRWRRSLVIGPETSTHVVPLDSFAPVEAGTGTLPLTSIRSILIVVDTIHTPPGRRGTVTLHGLRAEAP